jgi:hypothetical protein
MKIPVPPLEVQERFGSIVDRLSRIRKMQIQSKTEITKLFGSIRSEMFEGELAGKLNFKGFAANSAGISVVNRRGNST